MKSKYIKIILAVGFALAARSSQAALNLEGQSGIFLNSLAYPLAPGAIEVSAHNVNLDDLGGVTTYNAATGLKNNLELGYTRVTSSVNGVKDQNLLNLKWQFNKETKDAPAIAIYTQYRDLASGDNSFDYGISVTKLFNLGKFPTVVDFGARSTKALGLGLFGFGSDRQIKLEGSVAVFVAKNFAIGTEFKQQVNAQTWKDIAFRYVVNKNLNIDAGIADLGPGLRNQIALAATWSK